MQDNNQSIKLLSYIASHIDGTSHYRAYIDKFINICSNLLFSTNDFIDALSLNMVSDISLSLLERIGMVLFPTASKFENEIKASTTKNDSKNIGYELKNNERKLTIFLNKEFNVLLLWIISLIRTHKYKRAKFVLSQVTKIDGCPIKSECIVLDKFIDIVLNENRNSSVYASHSEDEILLNLNVSAFLSNPIADGNDEENENLSTMKKFLMAMDMMISTTATQIEREIGWRGNIPRVEKLLRSCSLGNDLYSIPSHINLAILYYQYAIEQGKQDPFQQSLEHIEKALMLIKEYENISNKNQLVFEWGTCCLYNLAFIFNKQAMPIEESGILDLLMKRLNDNPSLHDTYLNRDPLSIPHLKPIRFELPYQLVFLPHRRSLFNPDMTQKRLLSSLSLSGRSSQVLSTIQSKMHDQYFATFAREYAFACLECGKYEEADTVCNKYLALDSRDLSILMYLADACFHQGKIRSCWIHLSKVEEIIEMSWSKLPMQSKMAATAIKAVILNNKATIILLIKPNPNYVVDAIDLLEQSLSRVSSDNGNTQAFYNYMQLLLEDSQDISSRSRVFSNEKAKEMIKKWFVGIRKLFKNEEEMNDISLVESKNRVIEIESIAHDGVDHCGITISKEYQIESDIEKDSNKNAVIQRVAVSMKKLHLGVNQSSACELDSRALEYWKNQLLLQNMKKNGIEPEKKKQKKSSQSTIS